MDGEIIEAVPFQIDVENMERTLRLKEGSDLVEKLRPLVLEAQAVGRPRAFCKTAYVESRGDDQVVIDGTLFKSLILRVNLEEIHRVFPFVATCGDELEGWSKTFTDVLMAYWADAIKEMALRSAVQGLKEHLMARYQLDKLSAMNPGSLPDWPLTEQRPLFEVLGKGPESIGVRLTDSYLMIPIKSTSGIFFAGEEPFASCQLCERERCPGRKAPFDPGLYGRRYARKVSSA